MDTFFQQFINGLSLGAIYALIALGYTMVYGVLRLINFAHEGPNDGHEPGQYDRFSTVLLEKCVGAFHVVAVQQANRGAGSIRCPKDSWANDSSCSEIDGVPCEGGERQQAKGDGRVEHSGCGERSHSKEQGVAGQERRDDKACFRKHYRKDNSVDPGAVSGYQIAQMLVAVENKIDERGHYFLAGPATSFTMNSVSPGLMMRVCLSQVSAKDANETKDRR